MNQNVIETIKQIVSIYPNVILHDDYAHLFLNIHNIESIDDKISFYLPYKEFVSDIDELKKIASNFTWTGKNNYNNYNEYISEVFSDHVKNNYNEYIITNDNLLYNGYSNNKYDSFNINGFKIRIQKDKEYEKVMFEMNDFYIIFNFKKIEVYKNLYLEFDKFFINVAHPDIDFKWILDIVNNSNMTDKQIKNIYGKKFVEYQKCKFYDDNLKFLNSKTINVKHPSDVFDDAIKYSIKDFKV